MHCSGLVVRPAQESDAAAVADVYAPYVIDTAVSFETEPPTAAIMAERSSGTLATHPWLVAQRGDTVVGYAYAGRHSGRAAYRWTVDVTVYVGTQERQRGIGRVLYLALVAVFRQGFRSAFAEIALPNPGSIRLHEALELQHVGIHKDIGFKLGCWRDIGYWRLGLAEGAAPPSEPIAFASLRMMPEFSGAFSPAD